MKFPFRARLIQTPGSEFASQNMTVGEVYTILGQAGCCIECTTDLEGNTTIISPDWFSCDTRQDDNTTI